MLKNLFELPPPRARAESTLDFSVIVKREFALKRVHTAELDLPLKSPYGYAGSLFHILIEYHGMTPFTAAFHKCTEITPIFQQTENS